jgi:hypothetical protein
MRGEFRRCPVEFWFVAIGYGDQRTGIVRNDEFGYAADERQGATDSSQPIRLRLSRRGTGEGIAGGTEYGDEDARRPNLAGIGVNDRHRRTGVVGEQLLAGAVGLAHGALELPCPGFVACAECGVLESGDANRGSVFFPKQGEGDAFAFEFLVHHRVVGFDEG